MNHKIEIQRHAKVADFIGHNDMIQKSAAEQEAGASLYKTEVETATQGNNIAEYVYATKLTGEFIGGILFMNEKPVDYTFALPQHNDMLAAMKIS